MSMKEIISDLTKHFCVGLIGCAVLMIIMVIASAFAVWLCRFATWLFEVLI